MSFVKKQNNGNKSNNISRSSPTVNVQNKMEEKKKIKKEILKNQLTLVQNKHVRAVPGGYYTGLINDMHKDYQNFHEKNTFRQMESLNPLIQELKHTSPSITHLNDERKLEKLQAPITLNSLSLQCTLPSNYQHLENLSPLSFLIKYTKPSVNREQILLKLIRKSQRDRTIEIDDAKEIIFEYFNHYQTHEEIDELIHFLDIQFFEKFQSKELVIICCYAERYFLYKLTKNEEISFKRSLQEMIDFEFLKRKLNGLKLTEGLQRLFRTLEIKQ